MIAGDNAATAEAFVHTLKRCYVGVNLTPDVRTVIEQPPGWLGYDNEVHPHRALSYGSPRSTLHNLAARRLG